MREVGAVEASIRPEIWGNVVVWKCDKCRKVLYSDTSKEHTLF